MPPLRSLNRFVNSYRFTFAQFGAGSVWAPLLLYAALSLTILLCLVFYLNPVSHAIWAPIVNGMSSLLSAIGLGDGNPELLTRYPARFFVLPQFFDNASLPFAILIEGLVLALAARAFAVRYVGSRSASRMEPISLRMCLYLALAWAAIHFLIVYATTYSPELFTQWLKGSPRRQQIFDFANYCFSLVLFTPFVYMFSWIALAPQGMNTFGGALKGSLKIFLKRPISSFLLIFLPTMILTYPLLWMMSGSTGFAAKLRPEVMGYLLGISLVTRAIQDFLYIGVATRITVEEL